ncbi:MAG: endonuclease MutS2, partial [Bacteroidota bacterium]
MVLLPEDVYEKLEFDKILDLLTHSCYGERGQAAVANIKPTGDLTRINRWLAEVDEFKRCIEQRQEFPIGPYQEVAEELRMLEIPGYVLAEEGLQKLNVLLLFIRDIYRFFTNERQEAYEALFNIIRPVEFNEDLLKAIERVIDEEGTIRPDASPDLQKIRRHMQSKYREMDRTFRLLIEQYR